MTAVATLSPGKMRLSALAHLGDAFEPDRLQHVILAQLPPSLRDLRTSFMQCEIKYG
jgi:hypothetical protein